MRAQANQVGHLVCGSCSITLMYAHGAQSVKCAVCNHVTPVTGGAAALPAPAAAAPGPASQHPMLAVNGGGFGGAAGGGAQAGGGSGGVTVVVENPMSLDEHGNEARSRPACPLRSARAAHGSVCGWTRTCVPAMYLHKPTTVHPCVMLSHVEVYNSSFDKFLMYVSWSAVWYGAGQVWPALGVCVLRCAVEHRMALTSQVCARLQVQSLAVGVTSKESSAAGAARG